MKIRMTLLAAGFLALTGLTALAWAGDAPAQKPAVKPHVEVVFCLDTTGSMGGLIDAAKKKIWAISNQIAGGNPTPQVKIGLVAYRDRGDAYVTKVSDLTDDLDAIHAQVMNFQAQGGGDFPESVNQALHEAVTKITWSKDKKTLKMIFLVGDAPPHMDYPDDVKYPATCQLAVKNDIIINTVQCGNHAETEKYWREICRLAEGSYVQIDARGGPIVAVATPFDKELGEINGKLARSTLVYGDRQAQADGKGKAATAAALPAAAAAERAGFNAQLKQAASYDLLDNVKKGAVKLESLKKDELPEELKGLNLEEQKKCLDKLDKERTELNRRAGELDKQRKEYIGKKLAEDEKNRARDSFDNQVLRILQTQANRNGNLQYSVEEKKK